MTQSSQKVKKQWVLYLLECENKALYTGITNDLEKRFKAHATGNGAKYTRANKPIRIVASREYPDKSTAAKAEWITKQLPRNKKIPFVQESSNA